MNQKFIDRFHALEKIDQLDQNAKQNRGIQFENLMHDIFTNEGILLRKGFHTADNRSEPNRIRTILIRWENAIKSMIFGRFEAVLSLNPSPKRETLIRASNTDPALKTHTRP